MQLSPGSDLTQSSAGRDLAGDQLTVEIELGLLTAVLRMEMRGLVLLVVHPDHHAEEG